MLFSSKRQRSASGVELAIEAIELQLGKWKSNVGKVPC